METDSLPFPQQSTAGQFSWPDEFDLYSLRRPRFDLRPVHLRQSGPRASVYPITSAVSIIPLMFHTHLVLRGPLMVAQWLRYCATNWKVAGSIPDGVTGIFYWRNPSDRIMALGSTQPLTEMSTKSISCGWRRPVPKADNLTTILCRCRVIWEP
jgi:hypothetical protein